MRRLAPNILSAAIGAATVASAVGAPCGGVAWAWSNTRGGDHGGAAWTPEDGAVLGGVHTNVGTFSVPAGAVVTVLPREDRAFGTFEVHACRIEIDGTLSADHAGFPGGETPAEGGGSEGGGAGPGCGGGPGFRPANGGAGGGHGGVGGSTDPNNPWGGGACRECDHPTDVFCRPEPGRSYGTAEGERTDLGSGGGSGGNGFECVDSGGRGGRGGGVIRLLAAEAMVLAGVVSANGEKPPDDVALCGAHPGGGGGAGGSILVQTPGMLSGGGRLEAKGGGGGDSDGCPEGCDDWAWAGGGGGGGRIKAATEADRWDGTVSVEGGLGGAGEGWNSYDGESGENGTVFFTAAPLTEVRACRICGDGLVFAGDVGAEACDDGNATGGDGCSDWCSIEAGYTCTGSPSVCSAICGDGLVVGDEGCDDANRVDGDGCSATCTTEAVEEEDAGVTVDAAPEPVRDAGAPPDAGAELDAGGAARRRVKYGCGCASAATPGRGALGALALLVFAAGSRRRGHGR